jgi:hypothetical protein
MPEVDVMIAGVAVRKQQRHNCANDQDKAASLFTLKEFSEQIPFPFLHISKDT